MGADEQLVTWQAASQRSPILIPVPDVHDENRSLNESHESAIVRWWRLKVQQRVYRRLAARAPRVHGSGPLLVAIGDSYTDPRCAYTLPRQVWLRIAGRAGYRTLNLGVSGDTTGDMSQRIEEILSEGQPEIVVVFGGVNDAQRGIDPADTERNLAFMVQWLRDHGIGRVVLIGPPLVNWRPRPDWVSSALEVRTSMRAVAERYGAVWVDLIRFLGDRIERGQDPDFSRVRYRQSGSWHVEAGDPHLNAYGQRLVAEAFLTATSGWRNSRGRGRVWLVGRNGPELGGARPCG